MRTTRVRLENMVTSINKMLGLPETQYTKKGSEYIPNIGNLHIDGAYGGVGLHQMYNDGGGIEAIKHGYGTKPEMDIFLQGMVAALRLTNECK